MALPIIGGILGAIGKAVGVATVETLETTVATAAPLAAEAGAVAATGTAASLAATGGAEVAVGTAAQGIGVGTEIAGQAAIKGAESASKIGMELGESVIKANQALAGQIEGNLLQKGADFALRDLAGNMGRSTPEAVTQTAESVASLDNPAEMLQRILQNQEFLQEVASQTNLDVQAITERLNAIAEKLYTPEEVVKLTKREIAFLLSLYTAGVVIESAQEEIER